MIAQLQILREIELRKERKALDLTGPTTLARGGRSELTVLRKSKIFDGHAPCPTINQQLTLWGYVED